MAVALCGHDFVGSVGAVHHAHEVDLDHAPPLREAEIPRVAGHCNAGVIEHQIESSVTGLGLRNEGRNGCGIGHIQGRRAGRLRAHRVDRIGHRLRTGKIDVAHHHRRTATPEFQRQRAANA